MIGHPFKRAMAMMSAIAAAMTLPAHEQLAAMQNLGEYKSRGKGRGKVTYASKLTHNRNGHWQASNANGARACERRRRQIDSGFLNRSSGVELTTSWL